MSPSERLVADAHADSLMWNRDLTKASSEGHVDFPRLAEAGVIAPPLRMPGAGLFQPLNGVLVLGDSHRARGEVDTDRHEGVLVVWGPAPRRRGQSTSAASVFDVRTHVASVTSRFPHADMDAAASLPAPGSGLPRLTSRCI